MDGYITLTQAAKILGCNVETLRDWAASKRLQAVRMGAMWLTTRAWLRAAGKPALVGMRVRALGLTPGRPASTRRAR